MHILTLPFAVEAIKILEDFQNPFSFFAIKSESDVRFGERAVQNMEYVFCR